jgi:hypothetical protein
MEFDLFDSLIGRLSKQKDAFVRRCMFDALDTDDSGAITVREFLHRTCMGWLCVGGPPE